LYAEVIPSQSLLWEATTRVVRIEVIVQVARVHVSQIPDAGAKRSEELADHIIVPVDSSWLVADTLIHVRRTVRLERIRVYGHESYEPF
jgi:hypothetical protein